MSNQQFDLTIDLAASPQQVWNALTQAPELTRWFAPNARVTPGLSGEMVLTWNDMISSHCPITGWAPPHKLSLDWSEGDSPHTAVEFSISGEGGASTLRVRHSGFAADASHAYQSVARGWTLETRVLRHYLQRFSGQDRYLKLSQTAVPDMSAGRWRALAQRWSMPDPVEIRPGQHFPITMPDGLLPGGTLLAGFVDQDLLIELDALHGGLLRIGVESSGQGFGGQPQLWLWVMDWGGQTSAVDRVFASLEEGVKAIA